MSAITRKLILSKNLNAFKIMTASLTNVSSKVNKFASTSKILSQQPVKIVSLSCLKANYSTVDKSSNEINDRIKLLLKGNKVVLFIKGNFLKNV
jgi:hypothetical protein